MPAPVYWRISKAEEVFMADDVLIHKAATIKRPAPQAIAFR